MPKFSKVKRCYHCGEILQCEQKDLPGYVKKETLEKYPDGLLLCDNCYESESAKIPQECKLDDEFVTILEQIKSNKEICSLIDDDILNKLLDGIASHMGQWDYDYKLKKKVLPKPKGKLQNIIHMCDYLSSRKCFVIDFDAYK